MRERRLLLACLTLGAAGWAGCGSGSEAVGPSSHPTRVFEGESIVGGRSQLTFRPVIQQLPVTGLPPTTPAGKVTNTGTVVLPGKDASGRVTARYVLGPVLLDGRVLSRATAVQNQIGQWEVDFFTTQKGARAFDAMALAEYQHVVAVVLGDVVLSAPQVDATSFHGSGQIVSDFTAREAKTLAEILNTPG